MTLASAAGDTPGGVGLCRAKERGAAITAAILATIAIAHPAAADEKDACIAAAEKSQTERRAGHLGAARELLVTCSADACPTVIRSDCARWLGEVEGATASVVVHVTDATGEDVRAGDVAIDGAPSPKALEGRAIPLDPGPHQIKVVAREVTVRRDFVLREGEKGRALAVTLGAPVPPPHRQVPRAAFILAGAGAVSTTAGVALWTMGLDQRGDLVKGCGATKSCTDRQIDISRSKLIAGDVFFFAGVSAVGTSLVWGLVTYLGGPKQPPPVSAGALPGGAGLNLHGSF